MVEEQLIKAIIVMILFSVFIGITLREYEIDNYKSIMINIYFNLTIILSIFVLNYFDKAMIQFVNNNINFIMVLIGMISIFIGFRFIFELKNKKNNLNCGIKLNKNIINKDNITIKRLKYLIKSIKNSFSLPILFVIGYLGILFNILQAAPNIWVSPIELGLYSCIVSFILIIVTYTLSIKIEEYLHDGLIGVFITLSGIYYLIIYMFIPSLQNALTSKTAPLTLSTDIGVIYFLIIGVIAILLGFFLKNSKKFHKIL